MAIPDGLCLWKVNELEGGQERNVDRLYGDRKIVGLRW